MEWYTRTETKMSNRTIDRRRRRILQKNLTAPSESVLRVDLHSAENDEPVLIAVADLVPSAVWKIVLAQITATGAVLWLWWTSTGPKSTQQMTILAGLLTMLAGQLTLLIGRVRSTSDLDFGGQYRIWARTALALLGAGFITVLDFGDSLAAAAIHATEAMTGPLKAARPAIVFAPAFAIALYLSNGLMRDMKNSTISRSLLAIGILCLMLTQLLKHGAQLATVTETTASAINLLGAFATVSAMYWHAHFVTHVSRHPPQNIVDSTPQDSEIRLSIDDAQPQPFEDPADSATPEPADDSQDRRLRKSGRRAA